MPPRPQGKNRDRFPWGWITCGILLLLLVAGSCGTFIYFGVDTYQRTNDAIRPIIEDHLHRMAAGDYDAVYAEATPEFRRSMGKAEFIAYWEETLGTLGEPGPFTRTFLNVSFQTDQNGSTGTAQYSVDCQFAQGTGIIEATLEKRGDTWKLAEVIYAIINHIPREAPPS